MTERHNHNPRMSLLPARTVTRRDALRFLIGAGAALAAMPLRAFADESDDEKLERALDQGFEASDATNEALEEAQAKYDETAAELERIGQEYAELSAKHDETLAEIERVTDEIERTQAEIEQTQAEIERKQRDIERKQKRLGDRMSSAYKSGSTGVLDLLFSATSFDEFTSSVYYLDKITEQDHMMIESIKDDKAALEEEKRKLEEKKSELEAYEAQLEGLRQQEEQELDQIRAKQAEVQELLNELDEQVSELMAQRDAEIIEALERAEELERQRQAAAESSGDGGGVYGAIVYESGGSYSQMAVVNAASWTPSTGAGYCAAWVSNVFANAGVGTIYGNACDMYWSYCWSSDLSEIQTGMIIAVPTEPYSYAAILYGHVGIYIGNGLVRHCVSGWVTTQSLDSWISQFGVTSTPRWGWLGGITLG